MNELIPIEFKGDIVITTKLLAMAYETEETNIKTNFNRNKSRFIEGKHYYKLEGSDLKEFKRVVTESNEPLSEEIKFASVLYLWTKQGASRHCKILDTDKSWDMFDLLEESYFNGNIPQLTETQKLILIITDPKINEDTRTQALIKLRQLEHKDGYDEGLDEGIKIGREEKEQELIDELNRRKNGNNVLLNLGQCASMLYNAWSNELNQNGIYKLDSGNINGYLVSRGLLIKEYLPKLYKDEYIYDINGNKKYENSPHYKITDDFKEFVSQEGYSFTGKTNDGRKDKIQYNVYFLERFINQHKESFLNYMFDKINN